MPNFTTPRRRFDITGFLLFGLSLVLFSSGIELFGEKIVATWLALAVIAVSLILLMAYVRHARRHPAPLISLSLFTVSYTHLDVYKRQDMTSSTLSEPRLVIIWNARV